jgi:hypothetical protein
MISERENVLFRWKLRGDVKQEKAALARLLA